MPEDLEVQTLEAGPDRADELVDMVLDWLQTNILKVVATKVIPLVMASGVVVAVLAWLQDAVGLDLDPAVVASFVVSVMAGVIGSAFAYVRNHGGAAHVGGILLELQKMREEGMGQLPPMSAEELPPSDDPVVPPGVTP